MAKVTITITDEPKGMLDISTEFEPPLGRDVRPHGAQACALYLLEMLKSSDKILVTEETLHGDDNAQIL